MQLAAAPPVMDRKPDGRRRVLGLLLIAPAVIALILGYVWPAVDTVLLSFQRRIMFKDGSEWIGLDNYTSKDGLGWASYGNVFLAVLVPLLVVTVVAFGLAIAGSVAGTSGRRVVRLALVLPMVAPAGGLLALAWHTFGADGVRLPVTVIVWLSTFGLLCGVGATVYLAALRRDPGKGLTTRLWSVATVAALLSIGVVAAGLQLFSVAVLPYSATTGQFPVNRIFRSAILSFSLGGAAAVATPLLVVLAVLGVAATAIVVATRLCATVEPAKSTPRNAPALVATIVGSIIVLGITVLGLIPWLIDAGEVEPHIAGTVAGTMIASLLPPVVSTVVSIVLALLAAIGISVVRPLGDRSEWLLMLFAPFLFVGTAPLLPGSFHTDTISDFTGLIPPVWIAVPALLIFSVFLRGQCERYAPASAGDVVVKVILPVLPLVLLVGGAMWVVQSQDLFWQLNYSPNGAGTGLVTVFSVVQGSFGVPKHLPLGLALPIWLVVVTAIGLAVLQIFYLDRLAIRIRDE